MTPAQAGVVPVPVSPIDGSGTGRARCVLAPNPGLMTLDGTNTWLVAEPGSAAAVVVDPGPDDEAHLRRVCSQAEQAGQRIAADRPDARAPRSLRRRARRSPASPAPRSAPSTRRTGWAPRACRLARWSTTAAARSRSSPRRGTPPTRSACYLRADRAVLTGDTVLGRGTAVIADDGNLADYLGSLDRLRALADAAACGRCCQVTVRCSATR